MYFFFIRPQTKKQNAQAVSLDKIKKIDKDWQAAEDLLPIQEQLVSNACADEINKGNTAFLFVSPCLDSDQSITRSLYRTGAG